MPGSSLDISHYHACISFSSSSSWMASLSSSCPATRALSLPASSQKKKKKYHMAFLWFSTPAQLRRLLLTHSLTALHSLSSLSLCHSFFSSSPMLYRLHDGHCCLLVWPSQPLSLSLSQVLLSSHSLLLSSLHIAIELIVSLLSLLVFTYFLHSLHIHTIFFLPHIFIVFIDTYSIPYSINILSDISPLFILSVSLWSFIHYIFFVHMPALSAEVASLSERETGSSESLLIFFILFVDCLPSYSHYAHYVWFHSTYSYFLRHSYIYRLFLPSCPIFTLSFSVHIIHSIFHYIFIFIIIRLSLLFSFLFHYLHSFIFIIIMSSPSLLLFTLFTLFRETYSLRLHYLFIIHIPLLSSSYLPSSLHRLSSFSLLFIFHIPSVVFFILSLLLLVVHRAFHHFLTYIFLSCLLLIFHHMAFSFTYCFTHTWRVSALSLFHLALVSGT